MVRNPDLVYGVVGDAESTVGNAKVGVGSWGVGTVPVASFTEEIATHRGLTLSWRVSTDYLTDYLRPLKTDEGRVDVLLRDDGGYSAVDRADGGNSFLLIPPSSRRPLRQRGTFHVTRYEESLVSSSVEEWDVEVEFQRDSDRTDTPSISETRAADEWGLQTRYGTIATSSVDADFLGTGEDGVERFELTARLSFEQAHAFEAALCLLAGQRVRPIADASNVLVDETAGNANTVTVTPPTAGSEVESGDYVVTEWESRRLNDGFQSVSFVIGAAG